MSRPVVLALAGTLALAALLSPPAAALRDPFAPPVIVAAAAPDAAVDPAAVPAPTVRHIVTVDQQRYVVAGARRLGVGERLGGWRIECIHERGVFARDEAGQRRHLPLFASVAATSIRPAAAEPPAHAGNTSNTAVACPEPAAKPREMQKRNPS